MSDEPKVTLKGEIAVQGKENVKQLSLLIANRKKSGLLGIEVRDGGAVRAKFEEKFALDEPEK